ncbi:hypothetical protein Dimus_030187 [Dionaea muscipula]
MAPSCFSLCSRASAALRSPLFSSLAQGQWLSPYLATSFDRGGGGATLLAFSSRSFLLSTASVHASVPRNSSVGSYVGGQKSKVRDYIRDGYLCNRGGHKSANLPIARPVAISTSLFVMALTPTQPRSSRAFLSGPVDNYRMAGHDFPPRGGAASVVNSEEAEAAGLSRGVGP